MTLAPGVLTGAYSFQAMTSPFVWVNPSTLPEGDYKARLTRLVEDTFESLKVADVRLRLEGATDVVGVLQDLAREFDAFQRDLASRARYSDVTVKDPHDRAQKINALVDPLD